MTTIVIVGVALALIFDFLNGMNDAANSIATVISTRVLTPRQGIVLAATCDALGAIAFGLSVATTVGKGVVDPGVVTPPLVVAALVGAIIWTFVCTKFGLPISVSHALVGGLCGATLVKAGPSALVSTGLIKIGAFIVVSPLFGMLLAFILMTLVSLLVRSWSKRRVETVFSKLQIASAAAFSLSHGSNDAQKTMGIISVLLFSAGLLGETFYVPIWVVVAAMSAICLGTATGGWKVIRTMGTRLTNLRPLGGFAAEAGGSIAVFTASALGIPVSTTHTIAGSIVGVGLANNVGAVRWGVATHIVWAWVLTIPVTALVGAGCFYLLNIFVH
ncbi:MAG: inorganic phosphate transporter [Myxococcota bacterium]|jgi:PiT family inorganic phosphate transporter|nr:inorganic phosphate transporter [Myxococcota bacterium]